MKYLLLTLLLCSTALLYGHVERNSVLLNTAVKQHPVSLGNAGKDATRNGVPRYGTVTARNGVPRYGTRRNGVPPYTSIDGIVQALYDVISGPAGERDWDRFQSLFYRDAVMGAVRTDSTGAPALRKLTPQEYIARNRDLFLKNAFYERELHRQVMRYAHLAQVHSAYELELHTPAGVQTRRGVNNIQLVFENQRWWITSLVWEEEKPGLPLYPQESGLTKIIALRHAEKAADGAEDPPLSEPGRQRAERLKKLLADISIDVLYSTKYKRNMQTLQPIAADRGLDISTYEVHDMSFVERVLREARGKTVLVAGHSNTIPDLVNAWIGEEKYAQLPDAEYSKIWMLTFEGERLVDCVLLNF